MKASRAPPSPVGNLSSDVQTDTIICVDALTGLKRLSNESIDCVMTSPPYWSLRNYGVKPTDWPDGSRCALGLEANCADYVSHLCDIFDDVFRVLKSSGTLWVNLGDSYANSGATVVQTRSTNADPKVLRKSLCLIPERFALAMVRRGWILRNRIVWRKPNHMPSSAKDRFTNSWEHLFLFVKSQKYHFDLDAVRMPHTTSTPKTARNPPKIRRSNSVGGRRLPPHGAMPGARHPNGKNPGDVWLIPTTPTKHAHIAAYPERLCERPILAGCPKGGVVLDPFMGSGTTAVVAQRMGRRFLGFEINPEYVKKARARVRDSQSSTHSIHLKGGGDTFIHNGKKDN